MASNGASSGASSGASGGASNVARTGASNGTSLARGAIGLREVLFQSVTSMAPAGAVALSIAGPPRPSCSWPPS